MYLIHPCSPPVEFLFPSEIQPAKLLNFNNAYTK